MNDLTNGLFEDMRPEMAIIVYKEEDTHSFYLERRNINRQGKMEAGVPLTEECLAGIVTSLSLSERQIVHGRLPENMLYADCRSGRDKFIWYRPEEKRKLYFSSNVEIENGEMYIPGLVYLAERGVLSVFAYKGKKVTERTKLYKAPFFNIYDTGKVCLGNANVRLPEERTYESVISYWEQMFWQSEFTSILGNNPVKGNLSTLIKNCLTTGCLFPCKELAIPAKITIGDLLK